MAEALGIPFIDGDDLHPASNVAKMSAGQPLNDADRLPWLLRIREKAVEVCKSQQVGVGEQAKGGQVTEAVRQLAEVHETSREAAVKDTEEAKHVQSVKEHASRRDEEILDAQQHGSGAKNGKHGAVMIACSALKRDYRQILRHGKPDGSNDINDDLHVYHIYLRVSPDELRRRMHARKGHFMKESMLQSQLATLEEPLDEPDCLVLEDGPVEDLVARGKSYFADIL